MKRTWALWLMVALLLIYLLGRLPGLTTLPVFTDESDNIYWARDVWGLHPLAAANVGHVLNVWWLSIFRPFEHPIWVSRAATVLFGALGLATVYAIARRLHSPGAGLVTASLYLLSPFVFFFDRLAVPESIAVCVSLFAVCAGIWFMESRRPRDAVLCGLSLLAAVAAKASMMAFLPVPFLAGLVFTTWRRPVRWAGTARLIAWAYGAFVAGWVPFWLLLKWRGYNLFALVEVYGASSPFDGLVDRVAANLSFVWEQTAAYLPVPLLLLSLACAVYLSVVRPRAACYLLGTAGVALAALVLVSRVAFGRYALMLTPFLLVLLGAGLVELRRPVLAALAVAWMLVVALPFFATAYTQPAALPLSAGDRWEYIVSQSAGYGRRDVAAHLARMHAATGKPVHAVGLVVACVSIELMLPAEAEVVLDCPPINWKGYRQHEYEALVEQRAAEYSPYYVIEDGLPYIHIEPLPVDLTLVESFPHPGGEVAVNLWLAESRE